MVNFQAPHTPYHDPGVLAAESTGTHTDPISAGGSLSDQYKNMVARLDFHLGEIVAGLDFSDTVLMVFADNGTPQPIVESPYVSSNAKGTVKHTGTNVPLIVRGPTNVVVQAGRVERSLVQMCDITATTLDILGVDPRLSVPSEKVLDGRSFLPRLRDLPGVGARRAVFTERTNPLRGTRPGSALTRWDYCVRNERFAIINENAQLLFDGSGDRSFTQGEALYDYAGTGLSDQDIHEATDLLAANATRTDLQEASLQNLRRERDAIFDSLEERLSLT